MVKRIPQKARGIHSRRERRLILIVTEGERNKTESMYFRHFNAGQKEYRVNIVPGNETDPVGMARKAEKVWTDSDCDADLGDAVYCVFDTDTDARKQREIDEAIRLSEQGHFEVILSNPCFEVWYIEHYGYTTRQFASDKDVLQELRKRLPEYTKSTDVFCQLSDRTEKAIQNTRLLERHHEETGHRRGMECNPCSEVYRIVERLMK